MSQLTLNTLAADVIPEPALQAIFGLRLKEASNWSLRAAGRRTTLLLVWDKEDFNGVPQYRGKRGQPWRKTQRGTPTPPKAREIPEKHAASTEPEKGPSVQDKAIKTLQERLDMLATQLQAVLSPEMKEVATSPIAVPVPEPSPLPPPPPKPAPQKKAKGKGKKGVMTSSTPTPTQSPGPAIELEKKIGGASEETTPKTPLRTVPPPVPFAGLEREAVQRELELREVCREFHLTGLITDKRKAQIFITAVMHMGFRSLQTSPPRRQQWYSAVQLLSKQHWDLFRESPFCQLSNIAEALGVKHGIYFPKQQRNEVRTAKQLADWEENRGTFHQPE